MSEGFEEKMKAKEAERMRVIQWANCNCGAITVTTTRGHDFSVRASLFTDFYPTLDLSTIKQLPDLESCNHCMKQQGLDLCGCGSGVKHGYCTKGTYTFQCEYPMQSLVHDYISVENSVINGAGSGRFIRAGEKA